MRVPHDRSADSFAGSCPFHGDCLEGLASGTALEARWGLPASELQDRAAWALEAQYLALGFVAVVTILSPQRIVVGGGVGRHPGLLPLVGRELSALMNGYLGFELPDDYITEPALGARSGVLGAIALAETASAAT